MQVQSFLHSLEFGSGKKWIQRTLYLLLFISLVLFYTLTQFRGFLHRDSMDHAQLARQLARGEGWTTSYLRPQALALLLQQDLTQSSPTSYPLNHFPEIHQAPAYPWLLSVLFSLTQPDFSPSPAVLAEKGFAPEIQIILLNQLCFLLTALLLYLWSAQMFDRRVAFLALAGLTVCDLLWQFTLTGFSSCWALLVTTSFLASFYQAIQAHLESKHKSLWVWMLGSTLLLALMVLSQTTLIGVSLPFFFFYFFSSHRLLTFASLAVYLLALAPWVSHTIEVSGIPWGGQFHMLFAQQTDLSATDLERLGTSHLPQGKVLTLLQKTKEGLYYGFEHFFTLSGSSPLILLFLTSFLHSWKQRSVRLFRLFFPFFCLSALAGASLLFPNPPALSESNNLILFFPGMVALGAAFFFVLIDRLSLPPLVFRYLILPFFLFLCGFLLFLKWLPLTPSPSPYPPYAPSVLRALSDQMKPGEIMVSDMAWATAWYGDRVSLLLPSRLEALLTLQNDYPEITGLLLTPVTWSQPLIEIDKGAWKDWAPLIRRQGLPPYFPFPFYWELPPRENDYLFFSNQKRK